MSLYFPWKLTEIIKMAVDKLSEIKNNRFNIKKVEVNG